MSFRYYINMALLTRKFMNKTPKLSFYKAIGEKTAPGDT